MIAVKMNNHERKQRIRMTVIDYLLVTRIDCWMISSEIVMERI